MVSTEGQNQNLKFAAQFPHRHHKCQYHSAQEQPLIIAFCAEQCVVVKLLDKYSVCM